MTEIAEALPVSAASSVARPRSDPRTVLRDYVTLTKPRIMSLLVLTSVCAMVAAAHGAVDAERLDRCRAAAISAMPTAAAHRKALAALVSQKRLPGTAIRSDLRELVNLSLHCRAALDALGPTVDRRAADAIGNKVLVELREATLTYLAIARQRGDGSTEKSRAAVVSHLEKTAAHAKSLEALANESTGEAADTLGASMSKDVVGALHLTSLKWTTETDRAV